MINPEQTLNDLNVFFGFFFVILNFIFNFQILLILYFNIYYSREYED